MSTGVKQSSKARQVIKYDDFVDRELARIRSHVKLSDIARHVMMLAAVGVAWLLILVILDHWVVDLGIWGRLAGLAALLGASAYFILRHVVPEMLRSINPAYAAVLAERSEPTLKSSLINFVMLRPKRDHLREVVYREVEQQAAQRLSQVELESAVDQSPLIRVCLALLITLCVFAGYTFLSPKSPFQTLARVFRPFSDIARPTRVRIGDVRPGDISVYAGRRVAISAVVDRPDDPADVWLVYSTPDGQVSDRRLPMFLDEPGLRHTSSLPEGTRGIERDIDYRIISGDAVAGPFRIRVSPSPTIFVEEIRYEPPEYTGLVAETTRDGGDIRGVEGTRVTIVARANQDIRQARIDFDPDLTTDDQAAAKDRLTMTHEGRTARATFVLALKEDRKTPLHQAYQLRFTSQDGQTNEEWIEYPIVVTPDLSPLVDILIPNRLRVQVPIQARQMIQLRALDPDYGLADVRLQAVVNNEKLLDESLLVDVPAEGAQRLEYAFRPQALGLRVGDVVLYRGQARDTRRDALTGEVAPNSAITPWHALQIVAGPAADGSSSRQPGLSNEDAPPEAGDEADDGEGKQGENQAQQGDAPAGGGETGDGSEQGGANGEPQGAGGESEQADQMSGEPSANGEDGGGLAGEETGAGAAGDRPSEAGQQEGDADQAKRSPSGEPDPGAGDTSAGDQQPGDGPSEGGGENPGGGQNSSDGEPSKGEPSAGKQPPGQPPTGGEATDQTPADGEPTREGLPGEDGGPGTTLDQQGGASESASETGESVAAGDDASQEPLASDGSEDPDAFDRILEHMQEKFGARPEGASPSTGDSGAAPSDGAAPTKAAADQESATTGDQGDPGTDGTPDRPAGAPAEDASTETGEETAEPDPGAGEGDMGEGDMGAAEPDSGAAEGQRDPGPAEPGTGEAEIGESGEGESGQGESGQGESGQGESGEGESGEGESGEGESGQGESGQGESGEGESQAEETGDGSAASQAGKAAGESSRDGSSAEPTSAEGPPAGADASSPSQDGSSSGEASGAPQSTGGATSGGDRGERGTGELGMEPGGTDPNLEYARKATDMVLDYLQDQPDDRELLDRLGWTPAQRDEFLARWEQLRREAAASGPGPAGEPSAWNEALRSLGLQPGRDPLRSAGKRVDKNNRVTDAGTRSPPPPEYAEQYEAYLKGLGGAKGAP